uniref:Uncharacterized protein n=1 Tax=Setaria italica TaxID=4555 RepID=K3XTF0_SETIT
MVILSKTDSYVSQFLELTLKSGLLFCCSHLYSIDCYAV